MHILRTWYCPNVTFTWTFWELHIIITMYHLHKHFENLILSWCNNYINILRTFTISPCNIYMNLLRTWYCPDVTFTWTFWELHIITMYHLHKHVENFTLSPCNMRTWCCHDVTFTWTFWELHNITMYHSHQHFENLILSWCNIYMNILRTSHYNHVPFTWTFWELHNITM
jgi:hypothetical protein